MMLALLVRRATVIMMLVHALIAAVTLATGFCLQRQTAGLEERKVVCFACGKSRRQQPPGACFHHNLGFAGVTLFLATVMLSLFF